MPELSPRRRQQRMAILQKRADWLAKRIQEHPGGDLSFDKAELAAIQWAIDELTALYPESAPPPKG